LLQEPVRPEANRLELALMELGVELDFSAGKINAAPMLVVL
jgi:hypothetical protein